MGAKSLYLDNRKKYFEQIRLANDIKAILSVERGMQRFKKYSRLWKTIDLDELVSSLFKNPIYNNNGQKYEITDQDSKYIIYCDNGGSYFRIGNKEIPESNKGHYLGSNLQFVLNETINGITSGTSKYRREQLTHFKMKINMKGK